MCYAKPISPSSLPTYWKKVKKQINIPNHAPMGKRIKIGVIDEGIDLSHPIFNKRGRSDVITRQMNRLVYGQLDHGTAVAAIISQLAPSAHLIDYNACDVDHKRVTPTKVIDSIRKAIHDRVHVINISLGKEFGENDPTVTKIEGLLQAASLKEIVVVAAVGNDGWYARENVLYPIQYPSDSSYVMTVGASTSPGSFVGNTRPGLTDFSSYGLTTRGVIKPDVLAPGEDILTVDLGSIDGYSYQSGTSFAAPIAAASAALLKEAHPEWTAEEIISSLCTHAIPLKDWISQKAYLPTIQGSGYLNVDAALRGELLLSPHKLHCIFTNDRERYEEVTRELTFRNKGERIRTYRCYLDQQLISGISLNFPESITLDPHETKKIKVTASIDPEIVVNKPITGRLYLCCEKEKINLPFVIGTYQDSGKK